MKIFNLQKINEYFKRNEIKRYENIELFHETDIAILVELLGHSVWLPKHEIVMERKGDKLNLEIPYWLLRRKFRSYQI
jgi:hypothetical protein